MSFIDKVREKLRMVLTLDRPPSVIAWAAALGILIGVSPYVGLHTYLALLVSGWFNLPVYPLLIGAYITNPFTIPFIYGFTTKLGLILLGRDASFNLDWRHLTLGDLIELGKNLLLPFVVGTHAAGLILSVLTYFIVYYAVKKYRGC